MVPRTTESLSNQAALAQAALLMGTRVSIRVDVVINVNQQNAPPADVQARHFAAPNVI
jgi:hypothetical protein